MSHHQTPVHGPGSQMFSHALRMEGKGATQKPPGTHTGSELLSAAFWAVCSNVLSKIPNA